MEIKMAESRLKIWLLGPAHPYRGGLAAIMQTMAKLWQQQGHEVKLKTFTVQYPSLLFPGKSQFTDEPKPEHLDIERCINTCNPLSWIKLGHRIKRERPDIVVLKYWTPFMAPAFGTIARIARKNHHTKFICQIDNVEPHEHHFFDGWFNKWFLGAIDGFVYMSEQVHGELKNYTSAPAIFSPHPMFENYGSRIDREEACRNLGIDPKCRYALFFGLIRDYKGLDWLLEAWQKLRRECRIAKEYKLIVAGEFYTDKAPYLERINSPELKDCIILHDRFIPDSEVKNFFSASDFLVLPYKSATQSGVTQIAYKFRLPVIVTNVGGLSEIVPDGKVGFVCEPSPDGVAHAIERIASEQLLSQMREQMEQESKRFSWEEMCRKLLEVYFMCQKR